jgi:RimJ/RimL family protein N-acetyltransferase
LSLILKTGNNVFHRVHRTKDDERLTIRRATRKDVGRVAKLIQELADERKYIATERVSREQKARWAKSVDDSQSLWAVAEVDGEVVGTLTLAPYYGRLEKTKHNKSLGMGVSRAYRNEGVGSALMNYATRWARRKRVAKITLSTFSTNKNAIRLYKKFGFQQEGRSKRQFLIDGEYVDEIMMSLFV